MSDVITVHFPGIVMTLTNYLIFVDETSKAAPATRDHDTITQSRDAVEELLAPFVESQDYVDESVMTLAILTRNPEVLKEVKG